METTSSCHEATGLVATSLGYEATRQRKKVIGWILKNAAALQYQSIFQMVLRACRTWHSGLKEVSLLLKIFTVAQKVIEDALSLEKISRIGARCADSPIFLGYQDFVLMRVYD